MYFRRDTRGRGFIADEFTSFCDRVTARRLCEGVRGFVDRIRSAVLGAHGQGEGKGKGKGEGEGDGCVKMRFVCACLFPDVAKWLRPYFVFRSHAGDLYTCKQQLSLGAAVPQLAQSSWPRTSRASS